MKHSYLSSSFKISLLLLFVIAAADCSRRSTDQSDRDGLPDEIVSEEARPNKVTGDYEFDSTNSPLYMDGNLYFTNNNFDNPEQSRTHRLSAAGELDTLAVDNGVVTSLQASGKGTMFACEMLGHRVVELDRDANVIRVVAGEFNGRRIDGPNDIVVDSKSGLYFSDSQFIAGGEKMQETPAVYYVNSQGEVIRVIEDIEFPNGMGLSPDGTTLYVANTRGTHLLAYDVNGDGTVDNRRNFAAVKMAEGAEQSGADGMAIDSEGNLYLATTQGLGVQVFNDTGEYLGRISLPATINNVNFGGADGKTLYISAQDGIYSIPTRIAGLELDLP